MSFDRCNGTPVSWLLLEQFNLGELSDDKTHDISLHLESCRSCQKSMDSVLNDFNNLKPLPLYSKKESLLSFEFKYNRVISLAAIMLITLSLFIFTPRIFKLKRVQKSADTQFILPNASINYKGGELALSITRNRNGITSSNPSGFIDGDRFSVNITCPPGKRSIDIVLFQGNNVYLPLKTEKPVECANNIPLPGGFILTGNQPVTICAITDNPKALSTILHYGRTKLPESSVCLTLNALK